MNRIPIPQLLLIFLLVRKKRTCEAGWSNAGHVRRMATLIWASGFLLQNGSLGTTDKTAAITSEDIFPAGVDHLQQTDVERLNARLTAWLDYWSLLHPSDSLEQAMLNLIVRLWKAKAGWIVEKADAPFPLEQAIAGAAAGRFEAYMGGEKV